MSDKIIDVTDQTQSTALAVREQAGAVDQPLQIDELHKRLEYVRAVMARELVKDVDYGTIPGCGDKPTLFQPGAQKLALTFQLAPVVKKEVLREFANMHREYEFTISMVTVSGRVLADGVGTCSTLESKYRFRQAERKCPACGKSTIIKGKAEYGGGWLCFAKKGGCGAKWLDGAKEIENQNVGRIEYDNPPDFWNTARKIAFKRAQVHASINATNTSELWSQDLEDSVEGPDDTPPEKTPAKANSAPAKGNGKETAKEAAKTVNAIQGWLELCKAKLIKSVNSDSLKAYAIKQTWINENQAIQQIPLLVMFPSADWNKTIAENQVSVRSDFDRIVAALSVSEPALPLEGSPPSPPSAAAPAETSPVPSPPPEEKVFFGTILCTIPKKGIGANGQPYTKYGIKSGTEQDPIWFNTFSDTLGKLAMSLQDKQCNFSYTSNDKGNLLTNLQLLQEELI